MKPFVRAIVFFSLLSAATTPTTDAAALTQPQCRELASAAQGVADSYNNLITNMQNTPWGDILAQLPQETSDLARVAQQANAKVELVLRDAVAAFDAFAAAMRRCRS
jgi:hypothetical protein